MKACVGPAARGSPQTPGLAPGPTLLRPQTFAARRRVSRANPLYGRCQRAELDRFQEERVKAGGGRRAFPLVEHAGGQSDDWRGRPAAGRLEAPQALRRLVTVETRHLEIH